MAVSEAKKKANAKWDSENMATLACKVKRAQAEAFKVYCEIQGRTSNAVLRDYVLGCIGEGKISEGPQEAAEAPCSPRGILVSLDTLKVAQRAAEVTGESVPDFVARAVDTQEKRDKMSLRVGINPAEREGGEQDGH